MATARILRLPELTARLGLHRTTIWRAVRDADFPPPIRLSKRSIGWLETDVDAWVIQRKIEASTRGANAA